MPETGPGSGNPIESPNSFDWGKPDGGSPGVYVDAPKPPESKTSPIDVLMQAHRRQVPELPTDAEHDAATHIEKVVNPSVEFRDLACAHTPEAMQWVSAAARGCGIVAIESGRENDEDQEYCSQVLTAMTQPGVTDADYAELKRYATARHDFSAALAEELRGTGTIISLIDANEDSPIDQLSRDLEWQRIQTSNSIANMEPLTKVVTAVDAQLRLQAQAHKRREDTMSFQLAALNNKYKAHVSPGQVIDVAIVRGGNHDRVGQRLSDAGYPVQVRRFGLSGEETEKHATHRDIAAEVLKNNPDQPIPPSLLDRVVLDSYYVDLLIKPTTDPSASRHDKAAYYEDTLAKVAHMSDAEVGQILAEISRATEQVQTQPADLPNALTQVRGLLHQNLQRIASTTP